MLEASDVTPERAEDSRAYPFYQSGITTIKLMGSNVSLKLLSSLFERTPQLEELQLPAPHLVSLYLYLVMLRKYAPDSLEHLNIVGWREYDLEYISPTSGCLRHFPNLKWVRLEAGMLRSNKKKSEA